MLSYIWIQLFVPIIADSTVQGGYNSIPSSSPMGEMFYPDRKPVGTDRSRAVQTGHFAC